MDQGQARRSTHAFPRLAGGYSHIPVRIFGPRLRSAPDGDMAANPMVAVMQKIALLGGHTVTPVASPSVAVVTGVSVTVRGQGRKVSVSRALPALNLR